MHRITLHGVADPCVSFELHDALEPLTRELRPAVIVDLSEVDDLHPAVVSVLLRQRRQARRQGGFVHLVRPTAPVACRTLDHVGLVGAGR